MKTSVGTWTLGLAASALLHLGAGAGLMAALQPEPVENQPVPESRLNVQAQQVNRARAQERPAPSEQANSSTPDQTALGQGAIAQSVASPQAVPAQTAAVQSAPSAVAPSQRVAADVVSPNRPTTALSAAIAPAAQPAAPVVLPVAQPAPQAIPQQQARITAPAAATQTTSTILPKTEEAAPTLPRSEPTVAAEIIQEKAQPNAQTPASVPPETLQAALLAPAAPQPARAPAQVAPSTAAALQTPTALKGKATLAFPGKTNVDPTSLAAFQSFTQPENAASTDVRDSLSALLNMPCARMQVIFDPDTTTLQLTGHIPDASRRAPVLEALQKQMGGDITVTDNLLVLPAPQCGALSGIAAVGLPQSTDQITNPLIVGADAHARAFRYTAGQPLVIDMAGADYPAYVYLDYFDADGNVIHLSPNDRAPLALVDAKAPITFGARNETETGLFVRIGPPYGQEIAAAFAASHPLYDGVRPIVEAAENYLVWMQARVADARAEHPDFKGEWVYFFVTTAAE